MPAIASRSGRRGRRAMAEIRQHPQTRSAILNDKLNGLTGIVRHRNRFNAKACDLNAALYINEVNRGFAKCSCRQCAIGSPGEVDRQALTAGQ